jgi:oxalate decarboxylase
MISRRDVLAATAAGGVVAAASMTLANAASAPEKSPISFGNPDDPPQGAINAKNLRSVTDPGPQNPAIRSQFPAAFSPPPTDVGSMPLSWASFNNAPRRIQNGGWAREVTQSDFAVAETLSGVNMRLTSGGIREMHWHQFAEWAYMTYGSCRITVLDELGRPYVADVNEGDLWYFPAGLPHSLQGLGADGCEFLIVFDDGHASEFTTLLMTEWFTHTPPNILADNFGVPVETFAKIPLRDLYIFQGDLPGDLAVDRAAVSGRGAPPHPFTFSLGSMAPTRETRGGTVRIADSRNFTVSTTVAAALLTIRPGGMREMHWHPNADEWQYWIKGKGQMTIFNTGPNAVTMDFNPGDVGYVKKNLGHYIKNTGDTDLQVLEVFKAPRFADVSLSDWITHTPPALVSQHLNVSAETIAKFPRNKPDIVPL